MMGSSGPQSSNTFDFNVVSAKPLFEQSVGRGAKFGPVKRLCLCRGEDRRPHHQIQPAHRRLVTDMIYAPVSSPKFQQTDRALRSINVQPFDAFDTMTLKQVPSTRLLAVK